MAVVPIDLTGPLALVGGVSGAAVLAYSLYMISSANKKERLLKEMRDEARLVSAFTVGFLLGGRK